MLGGLGLAASEAELQQITDWMVASGHLDEDTGMLFIGPETERRYGRRNFMELMSVFSSDPQVMILFGREEIGVVDPMVLVSKVPGQRILALAGRAWLVTAVDWRRKRAYVEPAEIGGQARWSSMPQPHSFMLTDAIRRVLLGSSPSAVQLSRRAVKRLAELRVDYADRVDSARTVVSRREGRARWWTWAGGRANAVLRAALSAVQPSLVAESYTIDNRHIALRSDATAQDVGQAIRAAKGMLGEGLERAVPDVTERAVKQLKFAELLPPALATSSLAARLADHQGAATVAARSVVTTHASQQASGPVDR